MRGFAPAIHSQFENTHEFSSEWYLWVFIDSGSASWPKLGKCLQKNSSPVRPARHRFHFGGTVEEFTTPARLHLVDSGGLRCRTGNAAEEPPENDGYRPNARSRLHRPSARSFLRLAVAAPHSRPEDTGRATTSEESALNLVPNICVIPRSGSPPFNENNAVVESPGGSSPV